MRCNLTSVTLLMSPESISYYAFNHYKKYFLDILSRVVVSYDQDDAHGLPHFSSFPYAVFTLSELEERWKASSEEILCFLHWLEYFRLILFTKDNDKLTIEPYVSSFVTARGDKFEGRARFTPFGEFCLGDFSDEELPLVMERINKCVTYTYPMSTLQALPLNVEKNEIGIFKSFSLF